MINIVMGVTTAFQQPASAVAVGRLVPKDKISNVSGLNSFSSNLIVIFKPMIAAALYAVGGLSLILLIDLASFVIAFTVLLFFIPIPEQIENKQHKSLFAELRKDLCFCRKKRVFFISCSQWH